MRLRRRALPPGWYPTDAEGLRPLLSAWLGEARGPGKALAALAPHAGWAFSGRIAALSWAALAPAQTCAVVGGHLPESYPILIAGEEGFETPLGPIAADLELRESLKEELAREGLSWTEDGQPDNTVEVQLPFLKDCMPEASLLWLRAPSGPGALSLGRALSRASQALGRSLAVLGSSDLTHYGPDYGFEPAGRGPAAIRWVREVNDKGFLDALLALDGDRALRAANEDAAACSAGGAAAALAFALAEGGTRAELLGYGTSRDTRDAPSFVGYGALAFFR